jgi:chromosome segregation ATPase
MNNQNDLPEQRDATQGKRKILFENRERLQKYRQEIQERRRQLEEGPYSAALQDELKGLAIKIDEIQAEILLLQHEVAGHRSDIGVQRVLIDQPPSDLKNLTEDSQERKENVQTFREASQTLKEDNQKNNESTRDTKESIRH